MTDLKISDMDPWVGGVLPGAMEVPGVFGGANYRFSIGQMTLASLGSVVVPIENGGTGESTAPAAIEALLPDYTGNANKRLGLNGSASGLAWVSDGGGTVTSVGLSGGTTGLTVSGSPITASGTMTLGGTLAVANGGTGQNSALTVSTLIYGASATAMASATGLFTNGSTFGVGAGASSQQTFRVAGTYSSSTSPKPISADGTFPATATAFPTVYNSAVSFASGTYSVLALQHFSTSDPNPPAGVTIIEQYGFLVNALINATNNYGFRAVNAAAVGSGKVNYAFRSENNIATGGGTTWGFFGSGTANNALAGNTRLGSTAAPSVACDVTGAVAATTYVKTGSFTVATLPSASGAGAGARAQVSDSNSTTFAAAVAGGGTNVMPVYSDGTVWKIG